MTFTDVKTFFLANRLHPATLLWDAPHRLTPAELRAVRSSMQTSRGRPRWIRY
jgi:hypothetical protein